MKLRTLIVRHHLLLLLLLVRLAVAIVAMATGAACTLVSCRYC